MTSPQMINSGRRLPGNVVMINRIIWTGLVGGQVFFAGAIVFMKQQGSLRSTGAPVNVLLLIDVALLIFGTIAGWVIERVMIKPTADDQALCSQYKTVNIITMALLEMPSFVGLIIVFLSASWWPGGIVPAICIVLQLLRFPRTTINTGVAA